MVNEYLMRKNLAAIGIDHAAFSNIPWDHMLELAEVAAAIIELDEKKRAREARKQRRRGR